MNVGMRDFAAVRGVIEVGDREWVIIDTSAAYALVSDNDRFHTDALNAYQALQSRGALFFITNYVIVEFQALAFPRLGYDPVAAFVGAAETLFEIEWIDMDTHRESWGLMVARWPRLSLVDATTVVVAQQLRCTVFTFDEDFRQEGLPVIP